MKDGVDRDRARRLVGTGEECFQRLLHAGVVSLDDSRHCVSPIPSLAGHVAERVPDAAPNGASP